MSTLSDGLPRRPPGAQTFEYRAADLDAAWTDEPVSNQMSADAAQQAWQQGYAAGAQHARAEVQAQLEAEKQAVGKALVDFAEEREHYFHEVEAEVVTLALAIARKILHRESQVDPLFLAAVVRVAIEKVAKGTDFVLRVHPERLHQWRDYFTSQTDLTALPELIDDASLEKNQCVMETRLGETDLGVEAQLKEIEHGLFDLLSKRP